MFTTCRFGVFMRDSFFLLHCLCALRGVLSERALPGMRARPRVLGTVSATAVVSLWRRAARVIKTGIKCFP